MPITPTENATDEAMRKLWSVCAEFIREHTIICPEATAEDRAYEHAPDLIEDVANIVGYHEYDDD